MAKTQISLRASGETQKQIDVLAEWWGETKTEVISRCVERSYRLESGRLARKVVISALNGHSIEIDKGLWVSTADTLLADTDTVGEVHSKLIHMMPLALVLRTTCGQVSEIDEAGIATHIRKIPDLD